MAPFMGEDSSCPAQHQNWNENHELPLPRSQAPGRQPLALLPAPPGGDEAAVWPQGFLAVTQVEKQLASQGEVELRRHTRVNIECDMLLMRGTEAISINELCLCGRSVCGGQAAPFLWPKLTGSGASCCYGSL